MKRFSTPAMFLSLFLAFASLPAGAAEPLVYGSNTSYAGPGKHPKTAVTGLLVDGRTRGVTFLCYDYILITNDKIKGEVSAVAERISGGRVDKIATFGKTRVQAFDLGQVPPGGDDSCLPDPDEQPDFNFGIAGDCVEINAPLAAGDLVRWSFAFKKGSKLKGAEAAIQVSGAILPLEGLSRRRARAERALEWAADRQIRLLPRR